MRTLSSYGLNGQEGESTFSENVKEGCVASQDQPAGSSLNKGDTVVFHLSKGAENVSVPNVCLLYTSVGGVSEGVEPGIDAHLYM